MVGINLHGEAGDMDDDEPKKDGTLHSHFIITKKTKTKK